MAKEKVLGLNRKLTVNESCNLDRTLAVIIFPLLLKFRKSTICCPSYFESLEEWQKILDKMIYSFQEIANGFENRPSQDDSKTYLKYEKKIDKGLKLFYKNYLYLWN